MQKMSIWILGALSLLAAEPFQVRMYLVASQADAFSSRKTETELARIFESIPLHTAILGTALIEGPPQSAEYRFNKLDAQIEKFRLSGIKTELILKPQLGKETYERLSPPTAEKFQAGATRLVDSLDIFNPEARAYYLDWTRRLVKHYATNESVESFALYGLSGNTEWGYAFVPAEDGIGLDPAAKGQHARKAFQDWLKKKFSSDLRRANDVFGSSYSSFEEIDVPSKLKKIGLDRRPTWFFFCQFYLDSMEDFLRESLEAIRRETQKPIGILFGGEVFGMGFLKGGSIPGRDLALLSKYAPAFCKTPGAVGFARAYTSIGNPLFGIPDLPEIAGSEGTKLADQGDILEQRMRVSDWIRSYFVNAASYATPALHYMGLNRLYDNEGNERPRTSLLVKSLIQLTRSLDLEKPSPKVGIFNSYVSSIFHAPFYSTKIPARIYEAPSMPMKEACLSWASFFDQPAVLDEAMISAGGLKNLRVLIAASDQPLVTDLATTQKVTAWVEAGGILVLAGSEILEEAINDNGKFVKGLPLPTAAEKDQRLENSSIGISHFGKGHVLFSKRSLDLSDKDSLSFYEKAFPSQVRKILDGLGVAFLLNPGEGGLIRFAGIDRKSNTAVFFTWANGASVAEARKDFINRNHPDLQGMKILIYSGSDLGFELMPQ